MNIKTGEIKTFGHSDDLKRAMATGDWRLLERKPRSGCKSCYGRGYVGKNDRGEFVPCNCVLKPNRR